MKNKAYKLLSLILSILVLATACICPAIISSADTTKMLHVVGTHAGPLNSAVSVEAGETYAVEFSISNGVNFSVTAAHEVNRWETVATGVEKSKVDKGGYSEYKYEITIPDNYQTTYNAAYVGIKFLDADIDAYVFGLSAYKASDAAKTELYDNPGFESGNLNSWWFYYGSLNGKTTDTYTEGAKSTTVTLVDYDESKFPAPKMLHVVGTHAGPLNSAVSVKAGETYAVEFSMSASANFSVTATHEDNRWETVATGVEKSKVNKGGYNEYKYEIKIPDDYNTNNNTAYIGIKFDDADIDAYVFGLSAYKASDASKKEVYSNPGFESGNLNSWWFYYGSLAGKTTFTYTEGAKSTTVTLVDYDESLFPVDNMMYIDGELAGPVGQIINVERNGKYIYNVAVSNNVLFDVVTYHPTNGSDWTTDTTAKYISATDKGRYTEYTYEVTMPDKPKTLLGIRFKGADTYDCYLVSASVYKADDANKNNLYVNGDFADGTLTNWSYFKSGATATSGLTSYKAEYNGVSTTISTVGFNESRMVDIMADIPGAKFPVAHVTGTHRGPLLYQLHITPGETYVFNFGISNGSGFDVVLRDQDALYLGVDKAVIKKVFSLNKGGYTLYEYEVTVPSGYSKKVPYIGLAFTDPSIDAYVFNFSAHLKGDAEEKELLTNAKLRNKTLEGMRYYYGGTVKDSTTISYTEGARTSTVTLEDFDESKFPKLNMLSIESQSEGPVGQIVPVTVGGKYVYKFNISNNAKFDVVVYNKDLSAPVKAYVDYIRGEDWGRYAELQYEIEIIDNVSEAFVGVKFKDVAPYNAYISSVSMYKKDDTNKTEMLTNGDFASNTLDGLAFATETGMNGKASHQFSVGGKDVKLEVVPFDEEKMEKVAAVMPTPTPLMAHVTGQHYGPLSASISIEPEETYVLKFGINNDADFEVVMCNKDMRSTVLAKANTTPLYRENMGGYTLYEYEITAPSADAYKPDSAFVGIKLLGDDLDAYIFDIKAYKKSDATKTDLFSNPAFADGTLNGWWYEFGNLANSNTYWDNWSNKTSYVYLERFDSSKFPAPKAIHIQSESTGPIGQVVKVEARGVYTFNFTASNNALFDVVVCDKENRSIKLDASAYYIGGVDTGRYTQYSYEVVMPNINGEVFIGIQLKGTEPYDVYLSQFSLFKSNDAEQKTILTNGDLLTGTFDNWGFKNEKNLDGKSVYEFKDGTKNAKIEVVDLIEGNLQDVAAVLPQLGKNMIYFQKGAKSEIFSSRVASKPGKQYIFTFSTYSTYELTPALNANGMRGELASNTELISKVVNKEENYTTYTYKLTVPSNYNDDLVFLGVNIPFYAEGYLFDMDAYDASDSSKKSVFNDAVFAKGLDDWVLGWSATWFHHEGSQLKYWTDGTQFMQIVPYHLDFIDYLVTDINRDDGEWWSAEDIIEAAEEDKGIANVSGTFVDQAGNPVANIKIILKSAEKTYTTTTNAKGQFSFKNIVADYYDVYFVNAAGEEVLSSVSVILEDGDKATLSIVTDTTNVIKKSGFSGTVYTPQLKTVSNLKIYLRGFGETVTDADGKFAFTDVPVGDYELYTVLEDGSEYVFRTVSIKENVELAVKLKYDPVGTADVDDVDEGGNTFLDFIMDNLILIIAIASGVIVLIAIAIVVFIILKKKTAKQ